MLLTRPPLVPLTSLRRDQLASRARLACIRHAASVRPEPGSNSPIRKNAHSSLRRFVKGQTVNLLIVFESLALILYLKGYPF